MKRFSQEKREKVTKEATELRSQGKTQLEISKTLGISTASVMRYLLNGKKVAKASRKVKTLLPAPVEIMQRRGMMVIAIGPEDLVANSLHLIANLTGGH